VRESVIEIFREDIARFRTVLSAPDTASSLDEVRRGEIPSLSALRLHNGTVYRWNRPCYGITDGVPHLRIENRALPAGPTVVDEVANAAFFFGLMSSFVEEFRDIQSVFAFDDARNNFLKAARLGLGAQLRWTAGETHAAPALIRERLLPMAREGLREAKIDPDDIDRYLGILEARVSGGRTGARWVFDSLQAMGTTSTRDRRLRTLVAAMQRRQEEGTPVHTWEPATLAEAGGWRAGYRTVGQFMTTDLFTVRTGDVIDLAASLMDWEHIRHVPVEDDDGRLVGLVSHRALLRLLARGVGDPARPVSVGDLMKTDVVSIAPETTALEAIACMKKHKVGCLPVVSAGRLVGIVTVSDFLDATAEIFEREMREEGTS
jgi:CBS domain-containing protein